MGRILSAKELLNLTPEQEDQISQSRLLEDAETDLLRAIEDGKRELSRLEKEETDAVKAYVLDGDGVTALLKPARDHEAKKADVMTLERIYKERFKKTAAKKK